MKLRVGYEFTYQFPQPTPCLLTLNIHHSRVGDLEAPDHIITTPSTLLTGYRDGFGNWCNRMVAPAGKVRITTGTIVRDSGQPDPVTPEVGQIPIEHLPFDTLDFLRPSRFCETDKLLDMSWELFGKARPGWGRVQAILRGDNQGENAFPSRLSRYRRDTGAHVTIGRLQTCSSLTEG